MWVWFLITATTNGVNLTDGLDGLAVGASVMSFLAYVLLAIWQYGQNCSFVDSEFCYTTQNPLDLGIVAASAAGAGAEAEAATAVMARSYAKLRSETRAQEVGSEPEI